MKLLGKEEKVGLLVIMALISLTYLTFKAGNLSLRKDRGIVLFADFNQVHGLEKGAQVRIAGVEAGRVKNIILKMDNGKPIWQKDINCYYCYACFNLCPEQAILVKNYIKKDGRYIHPGITAEDIAKQKEP